MKALRLMLVATMLVGMAACGGGGSVNMGQIPDSTINSLAMDVGYGVYRGVPDARPVLGTVCLIKDFSKPELVAAQLKEALGTMLTDADKLTDTDAQVALLSINNLVGMMDLQLQGKDTSRAGEVVKNVVDGMCKGVNLATPK